MKVGVVGLGLIGGSFAKAYKKEGHEVYAYDVNESVLSYASLSDTVDGELTKENISDCDLILICTYPRAAVEYMKENGPFIGEKPFVIDCCGTKQHVVENGMKIAKEYGFRYAGGHPMAGTQYSGFKYSKADMYKGAPMVIVPSEYDNPELLEHIKELLEPAGFRGISVTTAESHDNVIAFTSQLAHVVSNAYIKSPTAVGHKGVSAGSYRDLTRVARLNPEMWSELFLENKENLIREIDTLVDHLKEYRDAMADDDREKLTALLAEGSELKKEIDG